MKSYLLDTNICIFFLKGRNQLHEKIREIGVANCYISEITIAELMFGAENSSDIFKHRLEVEAFQSKLTVLPIFNALTIYAKEKARLRKSGNLIDDFDLLIGATAVANDLIMVTDNVNHLSRLQNIRIENWIA